MEVVNDNLSLARNKELYLLMGVVNARQEYIGHLTILLNFEKWIHNLKQQFDKIGLVLAIIDAEKRILFSSDRDLQNNLIKKHKLPLSHDRYFFTNMIPIPHSSFSLAFGYDKRNFWFCFKEKVIPQLLILITTCLFSVILFWCFRKRVHNEVKEHFSDVIATFASENKNYKNNIQKLAADFSDKEDLYKSKLKYSADFLEAHKVSAKEFDKLFSIINQNILLSLLEIKNLTRELVLFRKEESVFKLQQNEEIEIVTKIESKIEDLEGFCIKDQNNQANIEEAVKSIANAYSKEIFKKSLSFSYEVKANAKTINFNNLLFYQVLFSLLYISIDASRPGGTISLKVFKKTMHQVEMLVVLIKDHGFYLREDNNDYQLAKSRENPFHFRLSFDNILNVLEKYNGSIKTIYTKDGKAIELSLPYDQIYEQDIKNNVIPLRHP
jgi:hypothetical protein